MRITKTNCETTQGQHKEEKVMKRTLSIITAVALTASCFSAAFADNNTPPAKPGNSGTSMSQPGSSQSLQTLVDNGIISKETLDAILKYLEENPSTPPEKPDGEQPSGAPNGDMGGKPDGAPDGAPGDAPNGGMNGSAPGKPDGNAPGGMMLDDQTLSALLDAGIITQEEYEAIATFLQSSQMNAPAAPGGNGGPGGSSSSFTYVGATEITAAQETTDGVYLSDAYDENALLIDTTEAVTLNNPTVTKGGDSDGGDNCNFYGLNAAVLAKGGATVTINGGTVESDANGANGVFSYGGNGGRNGAAGDGTTVNISDTVITTTGDNAGGIMTTGGGITNAANLTVTTSGRSSAAIRTDRGGGTVSVSGGSYTTNGLGSPSIYSTADITVENAQLVSNLSEGVCIEGKNTITLKNCDLTANNTQCNGNATFLDTIMIYQSMSGDADSGTSAFTMTGGSLTSRSGHVFHVTNTHAIISLENVAISNEDSEGILLSVCDDGWNGSENNAELVAVSQQLEGTILVGSNSKLTLTLSNGSSFVGSISGNIQNSKGTTVSTEVGEVSVTLDDTSTWTLTADTYITSFTGNASQIISNGYQLYVGGTALTGTK